MERIKSMKECLMATVQAQMGNLQNVDTQELGAAIDMIKDLEEALYYCAITKSMEESKEHDKRYYGMEERYMDRDMDRPMGRMYYDGGRYNMRYNDGSGNMYYSGNNGSSSTSTSGNSTSSGNGSGNRYYTERDYPDIFVRDYREGRSPMSRRTYIESKEMKKDKATQIKELEHYLNELGEDLVEMIEDATPEEQQMLHKKLSTLTTKVQNLNV